MRSDRARTLYALAVIASCLGMPTPLLAGYWTTTLIPIGDGGYGAAKLSGTHVVWSQHDGTDYELFSYLSGVRVQVTDNSIEDINPKVFDDQIAWFQHDLHESPGPDHFAPTWKLVLDGQIISESLPIYTDLAIGPRGVSWSAPGGTAPTSHIYLFDGVKTERLSLNSIASNHNPSVGSKGVVWSGFDGPDNYAYFWDGATTRQLPANVGIGQLPKISGDRVVGLGVGEGWTVEAISIYDIARDTLKLIPIATEGFTAAPNLAGENVAWGKYVDGVNQVFWLDGEQPKQLSFGDTPAYGPFVSESLVAWSSQGPTWDIYVHDGSQTTLLTNGEARSSILDISETMCSGNAGMANKCSSCFRAT